MDIIELPSYRPIKNSFELDTVNRSVYENEISHWYKGHGWETAPAWDDLPFTCYTVKDAFKTNLAFCALYLTNSSIAIQDWTVVNPNVNHFKRIRALSFLCERLEKVVLSFGKSKILHFVVPDNLTEYLVKREGYQFSEKAAVLFKSPKQ